MTRARVHTCQHDWNRTTKSSKWANAHDWCAMGIRSPRGPWEKPLDLYFLASELKSASFVKFIYCSAFEPVHSSTIIAQRASAHSVTVMSAVSPKLFRRFTISVCGVAVSNLIRERQLIKRNSHRLLQQGQYLDTYTCMNSLNVDQTPKGIHSFSHRSVSYGQKMSEIHFGLLLLKFTQ